jgi:hypothetical protein
VRENIESKNVDKSDSSIVMNNSFKHMEQLSDNFIDVDKIFLKKREYISM